MKGRVDGFGDSAGRLSQFARFRWGGKEIWKRNPSEGYLVS
ncbi:MAG: hypothetical protein ACTS4X_00635 [Candidatus Hodgkinia cicadicola]